MTLLLNWGTCARACPSMPVGKGHHQHPAPQSFNESSTETFPNYGHPNNQKSLCSHQHFHYQINFNLQIDFIEKHNGSESKKSWFPIPAMPPICHTIEDESVFLTSLSKKCWDHNFLQNLWKGYCVVAAIKGHVITYWMSCKMIPKRWNSYRIVRKHKSLENYEIHKKYLEKKPKSDLIFPFFHSHCS